MAKYGHGIHFKLILQLVKKLFRVNKNIIVISNDENPIISLNNFIESHSFKEFL